MKSVLPRARVARSVSNLIGIFAFAATALAKPVEFEFKVPDNPEVKNPFARELWAEVVTPSNRTVVLPAYYEGKDVYAIHARPDEIGTYRLGNVAESTGGVRQDLKARVVSGKTFEVKTKNRLPSILRDPAHPTSFIRSDGRPFVPTGANVAWPNGDCVPFYRDAFAKFSKANLNWMRVWMVHWGSLNLDWLPEWMGQSPPPGGVDPRIAANWDQLLEAAEENGVYVQMVFQHHGQFTTGANSNWKDNPWNAANKGGILKTPTEFFTQPAARLITMLKYRYIVARWSWSPAIFAWELFNEVHWVDAIDKEKNAAVVAEWHGDMAELLRSVDLYRHLVTTSTDNVRSPIYAKMDFYQPHLYAADLIVGSRSMNFPAGAVDRPAFYGEVGDDHLDVADAVKKSGVAQVPPVWAALFGQSRLPSQPWVGATILEQQRAGELGAVQRFAVISRYAAQHDLQPFSAVVESASRMPLELRGCQVWQRRAAPEIDVPLDGRLPFGFADIPRIYVGWPDSIAEGFPDRATYRLELDHPTTVRARIVGAGNGQAGVQLLVDGKTSAEKSWAPNAADRPTAERPAELTAHIDAGRHTLVLQNAGKGDWIEVEALDLGVETAVLAAIGQRSSNFIAVWLWNRRGVFAVADAAPANGTIAIDDVPAGQWKVTWWDTINGTPLPTDETLTHAGGTLRLATPPIARHAAVVLAR